MNLQPQIEALQQQLKHHQDEAKRIKKALRHLEKAAEINGGQR